MNWAGAVRTSGGVSTGGGAAVAAPRQRKRDGGQRYGNAEPPGHDACINAQPAVQK